MKGSTSKRDFDEKSGFGVYRCEKTRVNAFTERKSEGDDIARDNREILNWSKQDNEHAKSHCLPKSDVRKYGHITN